MLTLWGEPISSYSRAQAIEDGELVDLSPWAREVGITFPVAITRAAWEDFIAWPEGCTTAQGQSERGRGHDVVWMLRCAIKAGQGGERVDFKVSRVIPGNSHHARPGCLYALCGPGDTPEPVITIMLEGED
jgi:hypothetical protein